MHFILEHVLEYGTHILLCEGPERLDFLEQMGMIRGSYKNMSQLWQSNPLTWFNFKSWISKKFGNQILSLWGHFPTYNHFEMPNFKGYLQALFRGQVPYTQNGQLYSLILSKYKYIIVHKEESWKCALINFF